MTAIYVIAAVLVVLFLIGAYRSMSAGASTGEDPKTVLVAVLATTDAAFAALDAEPEADSESARAVRRRLDGCSQALERIAAMPVDESLDHARTALELAVDELSWSARLRETPAYTRDPGLREAAAGLHDHVTANLAQAHAVLDV